MKHNWEYKRLGSLCNIVRGGSPRPIQDYLTDSEDGLNWIKIGDVAVGSKYITSTKEKIKKEGLSKTRQVFKGDFILSNSMSFGRPYILKIDGCIHDGWLAIKEVNNHFIPDFLYYYLSSPTTYAIFEKLVKGGVVSNLNSDIVKGIDVPVPPMEVQERIVAELDKINETIEDCRELLRNLDALAQSLFYDFFGDPVINPKGWRIYKIKDICSVNPTKREIRIPTSSEISFLPMEDLPINARYFTPIKVKTLNEVQNSYTYFSGEDVLFAKVTPCFENGKAGIPVNLINNIGFGSSELFVLRPNFQIINREYIYSFIRTNHFVSEAIKKLSGTSGLRRVPRTVVENFQIPVPPLELQEKFAARMEEIEAQKKTVESTIAELQTLLDSRMDYWFN